MHSHQTERDKKSKEIIVTCYLFYRITSTVRSFCFSQIAILCYCVSSSWRRAAAFIVHIYICMFMWCGSALAAQKICFSRNIRAYNKYSIFYNAARAFCVARQCNTNTHIRYKFYFFRWNVCVCRIIFGDMLR